MADARETLRIKVEALTRRGVVLSDLDRSALVRAFAQAQAEPSSVRHDPVSAVADRVRAQVAALRLSSREAARRLGVSRDRLRDILQGRGKPPAGFEERLQTLA